MAKVERKEHTVEELGQVVGGLTGYSGAQLHTLVDELARGEKMAGILR